jgi:MFS family permease
MKQGLTEAQSAPKPASPADASLAAFFRDMVPAERRTFWACTWGYVLDGMDFMIYPLLIGTIMAVWSVTPGDAGLAATLALLSSAFGGWFAGYISDRIGRKLTLQLTIVWFSMASLLCAFAQDFTQLIVFRTLLGVGFGGEWAAGAVLMGEAIRAEYRGRAVGCVQSAWAIGWGAAVLGQAILFSVLPTEIAWRSMFAIGLLPSLVLVWYIHRRVPEPAIASTARSRRQKDSQPAIWGIFSPPLLKTTALASLAFTGAHGGYYAINTWLPTYLKAVRGLTVVGSTGYLAVQIVGSFIGYLVGAWISDRFGRRPLFLVFSAGAAVTVVAYTQLPISNHAMLLLGLPLGFFSSGYFSGMGPFLTELFPTHLRGTGQGFCYNFGRGIGATFPALVGYLSVGMPLANIMSVFAVIAYGVFFLTTLILPETRGKVLYPD